MSPIIKIINNAHKGYARNVGARECGVFSWWEGLECEGAVRAVLGEEGDSGVRGAEGEVCGVVRVAEEGVSGVVLVAGVLGVAWVSFGEGGVLATVKQTQVTRSTSIRRRARFMVDLMRWSAEVQGALKALYLPNNKMRERNWIQAEMFYWELRAASEVFKLPNSLVERNRRARNDVNRVALPFRTSGNFCLSLVWFEHREFSIYSLHVRDFVCITFP